MDQLMQEMTALDIWTMLLRFCLAAVLGAFLGMERNLHGRDAGIRTHLLVSAGAALFTLISLAINHVVPGQHSDVGRIAAQVVSGIGFLGAGTIIRDGISIRGLTSAACLWISAAIGMAAAMGFYVVSIISTALVVIFLVAIKWMEQNFIRAKYLKLKLTVASETDLELVHKYLTETEIFTVQNASIHSAADKKVTVETTIEIYSRQSEIELAAKLTASLKPIREHILDFSVNT